MEGKELNIFSCTESVEDGCVRVQVSVFEKPLPMRRDLVSYSSEFEYGYSGSGPAQLSLAILAYQYDDELAVVAHQWFKEDVIAKIPHEKGVGYKWQLNAREIERSIKKWRVAQSPAFSAWVDALLVGGDAVTKAFGKTPDEIRSAKYLYDLEPDYEQFTEALKCSRRGDGLYLLTLFSFYNFDLAVEMADKDGVRAPTFGLVANILAGNEGLLEEEKKRLKALEVLLWNPPEF